MRSEDKDLEDAIDRTFVMLSAAKCEHSRRHWAERLEELVKQRSDARVREMERERWLS